MSSKKFYIGQRVRPSRYGIERNIFVGTYRGEKKAEWSGVVVAVSHLNYPTVKWDARKTASGYHPDFIAPDRRRKASAKQ